MKTVASNHLLITDGRLPVPQVSPALRAALQAMVIDIAKKLEHVAPSKHDALVLEWRVVGLEKGESMKGSEDVH